jgi:rhodanese-related sulfurtransferase
VPDNLDGVPRDGAVYVICAKGGRSLKAAEFYRAQGIDAVNVAGGTTAWIETGEPVSTGMEP